MLLHQSRFISRLNPLLFIKHRRIQNILIELGETPTPERIIQLQNTAGLELQQRPMREMTLKLLDTLYPETGHHGLYS